MMKQSETFEMSTEQTLSDAELTNVHGGHHAGAGAHPPEAAKGKLLPLDGLGIPPKKLETIPGKRLPGETPPILIIHTA